MISIIRGVLLVVVLLLGLGVPGRAVGQGSSSLPSSVDSALVRYVGRIAVERLAGSIAAAAERPESVWWQITLPRGGDSLVWDRLERHLLVALRGRDSLPSDSVRGILRVSDVRLNGAGDTLRFVITSGSAAICEGRWMGNTRSATYTAYRNSGTWMNDVKESDVEWAESFGCMW